MNKRKDWTDSENLAVCLAWCLMQAAEQRGQKFNKSAIRRELIGTEAQPGPLAARSNGSVEAKLMNCSAAALRLNYGTLKGYKPAPNYQASLLNAMVAAHGIIAEELQHTDTVDFSAASA